MKKYEFQKLCQPLFCGRHGAQWVANIEDIHHEEFDEEGNKVEYTVRKIKCAVEGCGNLMRELKI